MHLDSPVYSPYVYKKVTFPTRNLNRESRWAGNCLIGQLTDKGAVQLNTLGKALREIYVDKQKLLPPVLNSAERLYLRSSDYEYVIRLVILFYCR